MKLLQPMASEFFKGLAGGLRVADGFIIYIGDVTYMESVHAACFKNASKDIMHHKSTKITDVCRAVNGGSTAVKTKGFTVDGRELSFAAGEGVE